MKVAIYCRISQDREGAEVGVTNQEATGRELAAAMGAEVFEVYTDNDTGASSLSKKARPAYAAMIADVQTGQVQGIVAYSMSRLTRRPLEWVQLIELAQRLNLTFRFKVSPTFDLQTADGRATALTIAAWDAAEAERTGERIRYAVQAKLAKGQDTGGGPRPFGYEVSRDKLRKKEAEALQWAYGQILNGKSLLSIAQEFTRRGLKRDQAPDKAWRPQTVRHMLLRERNVGRLVVKGKLYSSELLPLIDVETFEAVKAILTDPKRKPLRGREAVTQPFSGLVTCATCGNYLRLASSRGSIYLKCAPDGRRLDSKGKKHPTILLRTAFQLMGNEIGSRLKIIALHGQEFSTTKPTKDIQLRLSELRRQRDLAQDMAFQPGANVPALKAKITKLGLEMDALNLEFDRVVSADIGGAALDAALAHLTASNDADDVWARYWESLPSESQRALIKAVMPNCKLKTKESSLLGVQRFEADLLPFMQSMKDEIIGK